MKHRSVVSNFIFRWSDAEKTQQQVALFKRSQDPNIRSYQGKYAPVAGSIECTDFNPVIAAEREICEETQLKAGSDVVLEFSGKSYSFEDADAQRSWTVHPFGWNLISDESKVRLDWEHSEWKWFDPQNVLDGSMDDQCVPRLKDSLQSVYLGPNGMFGGASRLINRENKAGRAFLKTIERLKTDIENGARVLATEALKGLLEITECIQDAATEDSWTSDHWLALRVAAFHIMYDARPSMNAAISSAIIDVLSTIANMIHEDHFDPDDVPHIINSCIEARAAASEKITCAFAKYIIGGVLPSVSLGRSSQRGREQEATPVLNIITLSFSSTVSAALGRLLCSNEFENVLLNLVILESRPLCEGASLAESLLSTIEPEYRSSMYARRCRLNLKIVPDSHAASTLIQTSDLTGQSSPDGTISTIILLGADRITPSGHIVNKTGSAGLATLAKTLPGYTSRRVVVLSETDKVAMPCGDKLSEYIEALQTKPSSGAVFEHSDALKALSDQEMKHATSEPHPAEEVYGSWNQKTRDLLLSYVNSQQSLDTINATAIHLEVGNLYFEHVPETFIDTFISEHGEMTRRDILNYSIARGKAETKLFDRLDHQA